MPEDLTPEDDVDPAADTQTFQAFVDRREADEREAAAAQRASTGRVVLAVLVALLVLAGLVWLILGR
ncbi:MAG TPA: hypothetical protein VHO29_06815 [Marmoricola sp.]|nr:hypothetical protein [Marmoricola sp.]